ncbi:Hypothetical protein LUCI_1545 [Lucifera butyrica]|uniref:HD domain-containing protein n=1 Tax=Lucifera butyrica TaxID=1351585 RepID=A0A498R4F5_9FIRM|nr:HD domain-containing protein [Lucifera butyrica]VBB06314.1 Hypothetical protein LUCI_1545 [Lucifera butyrica]
MEQSAFGDLIKANGGKLYIVGGYVRDLLMGGNPKDIDFAVAGMTEECFTAAFPAAIKAGKSFPVYLVMVDGRCCEVAFARTERKSGSGYKGFAVQYDPAVTIEEDLFRRDTTMNSMAIDTETMTLVDPYRGAGDIRRGIIRATSPHFSEDPVRALRAARQAAEFGFTVADATLELMRLCRRELMEEPRERYMTELRKALATPRPSVFFRILRVADLLDITYPPVYALIGQTQPELYHPEGDSFEHSMLVVDKVAAMTVRPEVRFAGLMHDIGKGITPPEELPSHHNHDAAGSGVLNGFNRFMTLPAVWLQCAKFACRHHMRVHTMKQAKKIVELIMELSKNPLGIDGFNAVLLADAGNLPGFLRHYDKILASLRMVDGRDAPPGLKGPRIGEWVLQERIKKYKQLESELANDNLP